MSIEVNLKDNGPFPKMLNTFKVKVGQSGVIRDIKNHEYYEKPSEKIRKKRLESIRRARKKLARRRERTKKIKKMRALN